jgi:ubiquinone/menaquinone biosynthesis C-methylase UbiE
MIYKFLDVGCKVGGSFDVSKKFGYTKNEGLGIDINEEHVKKFINSGYNGLVADATNLPFDDNSFELVIFSHVLEHLPNEELGKKALDECLRVSSKHVFLALPFFDEDEYLNSLRLKTYYSDWTGHKNKVHLKTILENYLKNYKYDLTLKTKITDSGFPEILPIEAPKNSHNYDEKIHSKKEKIFFDRDIWREYIILIKK